VESFNEWKIALTNCRPKAISDTEIELEMSGTMYTKVRTFSSLLHPLLLGRNSNTSEFSSKR